MKLLNVVSLFTGAGGLDYGFEAAGYKTSVAIEIDIDCCQTIRNNRDWPVIEDDIHKVTTSQILDTGALRLGEVDVLIGGPPCQPFSKASYWVNGDTKRLDDPRASTLNAYMRCVEQLLPTVFVFENVHGINYSGKEEGFRLVEQLTSIINSKHNTNYQLFWKIINTADYGIPQLRKRFFLIAHREGKEFKFPIPTHYPTDNNVMQLFSETPYVTAWDAIGNLEEPIGENLKLRGRWADLLPSIPEGENYLWHTIRKGGLPLFGWRNRYWSFLLKLAKDRPSWTIQAQPGPAIGPFHWKNRLLSVKEMAAIQTFPQDICFCGNRISIQRQIGNAVPSLMAEILGRAIAEQFFAIKPQPLKLTIPLKRPIPPPEKVSPVPEQFLHLQQNNKIHHEIVKSKMI